MLLLISPARKRPLRVANCRFEGRQTVTQDERAVRHEDVLDGKLGEAAQHRPEASTPTVGLQPRIRTHVKLAGVTPQHRIAEQERGLSRQPERDLIGTFDVKREQPAEETLAVGHRMIERMERSTAWWRLRPHLRTVSGRRSGNAPLVPVTGPQHPRAAATFTDQPIETSPINDERIDQHDPVRRSYRPPGDALLPTLVATFLFVPLRMQRLETPQPVQNLAD